MVDATLGVENQDLKIATLAWESGRSLILVVNKWDAKEKDEKTADKFRKDLVEKVPYFAWVPFLFTSARTGQRVHKVLDLILEVERERNKRIPTSQINEALEELVARRQPPQAAGNEVRLIYATQVETAPPSIAVFGNHPELVPEHYIRYLHNGFRERYGFLGNPLRILMRHKSAPATDHRRVRV
jgi:GTP-binding protein